MITRTAIATSAAPTKSSCRWPRLRGTRGGASAEAGRLRALLDETLASSTAALPTPIPPSDEERYALLGYLNPFRVAPAGDSNLDEAAEQITVDAHRAAAVLIGQKKYSAGIRALQSIVHAHPSLATVQYQLGELLVRMGRYDEAIRAFGTVRELRPDATAGALALADALVRAGKTMAAREQAATAIALAEHEDMRALAAAHEMAARVALADKDADAATQHADAAHAADPRRPVPQFVRGRLLFDDGKYEEAAASFTEAVDALKAHNGTLTDLHLYYGQSLARLDRYTDAETQFREELRAYPRNVEVYTSLAMLYRASNRDAAVEDVLNELVAPRRRPRAMRSRRGCGRYSASARGPKRSDPMLARASRAIRAWLNSSGRRGDKQQPDGGPRQVPHLPDERQRHSRDGMHGHQRRQRAVQRFVDPDPERNELEHRRDHAVEHFEHQGLCDRRTCPEQPVEREKDLVDREHVKRHVEQERLRHSCGRVAPERDHRLTDA